MASREHEREEEATKSNKKISFSPSNSILFFMMIWDWVKLEFSSFSRIFASKKLLMLIFSLKPQHHVYAAYLQNKFVYTLIRCGFEKALMTKWNAERNLFSLIFMEISLNDRTYFPHLKKFFFVCSSSNFAVNSAKTSPCVRFSFTREGEKASERGVSLWGVKVYH